MAGFHRPCQEQRLLFLTSSLNPVVCFDLKKTTKHHPKTNSQELEAEGRKASCQGGKRLIGKSPDWE